jgi:hypothetical protein
VLTRYPDKSGYLADRRLRFFAAPACASIPLE